MKSVAVFLLFLFLPFSAQALSCAWPSVEEAKRRYPVTVLGEVTASAFRALPEKERGMLARGHQQVTLKVEELRAPEGVKAENGALRFTEVISIYDRSFFKTGKRYVVFLKQDDEGGLYYPICGFHLHADDPMLDMEQVKADIGWK